MARIMKNYDSMFTNTIATSSIRACSSNCKCQQKRATSDKNIPGYEYLNYLGSGGFGTVHLYRDSKSKSTVAIKSMSYMSHGENILHEVKMEYDIVINLRHQNITKYHNFFVNATTERCYIVMEYASRGSLRNMLSTQSIKGTHFELKTVVKIIRDIVCGVEHLNSKKIVHCDLKPENILVGNDGLMKICDFGLAHFDYDIDGPVGGTIVYQAPELFQRDMRPNEKTEVWALGVILYELCNLRRPFTEYATTRQYVRVAQSPLNQPLNKCYGNDMVALLNMMLQVDPVRRKTLSYLKQSLRL